jgi:hypothetical protein
VNTVGVARLRMGVRRVQNVRAVEVILGHQ